MECKSMLLPSSYLIFEAFKIPFAAVSLIFTATKLFHRVLLEKKRNINLRINDSF